MLAQQLGFSLALLEFDAGSLAILGAQYRQRRHHRATVDLDLLQRHRQLALGQFVATGIQAPAQVLGRQLQQRRGIGAEVADDQGIAVARVPGQRQDHREEMALRGKASGDMHQRLQQAHLVEHLVLAAQLVEVIVQARLALTDQAGQGNGGADIGKRVVGLAMLQAVRRGEHFQLQRQPAVQLRPLDALRAQGIGGTDHVDQVPAAIAALPLAGVGIEEVAVQAVARHFVVEAQGVVAGHAGRRLRQLGVYPGHEVGLGQPPLGQPLGSDAGDQASHRVGQDIVAGTAIQVHRLADLVQRLVRADPGDLQRPVAARVDAGGFVVVPKNTRVHGHSLSGGTGQSTSDCREARDPLRGFPGFPTNSRKAP
ncbi:Uncharacterised protein [Klebsiella pneumoniae]|nr:Uncharacterised protein [Klebsiella pneumoniae]